jgi:hypothetical protein
VLTEETLYFTPSALFVLFPARLKRLPFSIFAIMENENIRENLQYFCKNMWWGGEVDFFVATHVNYFVLFILLLSFVSCKHFRYFLIMRKRNVRFNPIAAYSLPSLAHESWPWDNSADYYVFSTFYVCEFHKVTYIIYPWSKFFEYISLILCSEHC